MMFRKVKSYIVQHKEILVNTQDLFLRAVFFSLDLQDTCKRQVLHLEKVMLQILDDFSENRARADK